MTGTRITGPLFDGRAIRAADGLSVGIEDRAGQLIVNDVKAVLDVSVQNPTGNYERHIRTERQQNDLSVNDSGIIYGPWLEGISSRNVSTRFKGYAAFRKAFQSSQAKVMPIADGLLGTYMGKMS